MRPKRWSCVRQGASDSGAMSPLMKRAGNLAANTRVSEAKRLPIRETWMMGSGLVLREKHHCSYISLKIILSEYFIVSKHKNGVDVIPRGRQWLMYPIWSMPELPWQLQPMYRPNFSKVFQQQAQKCWIQKPYSRKRQFGMRTKRL